VSSPSPRPKVAARGAIDPFIVMEVMKAAADREAAGGDVLHMEVGQPSTAAPKGVIAAAKAALDEDRIGYTDALGIPALRQAIADHYRDYYGVDVPRERIVVTTGSSGAFLLTFLASFDVGDRVAMVVPGYPAYRNILTALAIEPVLIEADPETRFQPTPEMIDRAGPVDGVLVASPANPTGTMLDHDMMAALAGYCADKGIRLIVDEIYHGITYGGRAETAVVHNPDIVVINSFSKYFSMTGWRLGWMIVPSDLFRAVECLAQNMFISPPGLSQQAAIAAFSETAELDANVARYAANRAVLLEDLPKAGLDKLAPCDGAFYIYADVTRFTNDSPEFCARMLRETGIAATPGLDFDPLRGNRFVRFSFAGATDHMREAARRLQDWLK